MNSVKLEFQWTKNEFQNAVRRSFLVGALIPVVIFVLAGILFKEIAYFCFLAIVLASMPMFFVPWRLWKAVPGIQEDRHYEFSDEGLSVHSRLSDTRLTWETFTRSREYGRNYSLRGKRRGVFAIVPKSAFTSRADEDIFRRLLQSHTQANLKSLVS